MSTKRTILYSKQKTIAISRIMDNKSFLAYMLNHTVDMGDEMGHVIRTTSINKMRQSLCCLTQPVLIGRE